MSISKLYYNEEEIISTNGEELADLNDIENYMCLCGILTEGFYIISQGVVEITGKDEDYEVILIE